jgi:FtsP/CotA-like multicopper oxidase with cupredoxin domain
MARLSDIYTNHLFEEELTFPPTIAPVTQTTLTLKATMQKVHTLVPTTRFWAYNGQVPGPTLSVKANQSLRVRFVHNIATTIPFTSYVVADTTPPPPGITGAPMSFTGSTLGSQNTALVGLPAWTVTHLHGAPSQADSDGWTDNLAQKGDVVEKLYNFPAEQYWFEDAHGNKTTTFSGGIAPTYWYHDHAMGVTRFNVYAGLAGMCLVRDPREKMLGLPVGTENHELPLVIQDRNFETVDGKADGQLTGELLHKVQEGVMECFAPATLVNGKLWPHTHVSPRLYRLRLVNGSNARFYRLHFMGLKTANQAIPEVIDTKFVQQIGTDGGLLGQAVDLPIDGITDAPCLLIAPGERADVLIDFGGIKAAGYHHIAVYNSAPAPFDSVSSEIPTTDNTSTIYTPDPSDSSFRPHPAVMRFDLNRETPHPHTIQHMSLLGNDFHRVSHTDLPHQHQHTLIVLREENGMLFLHEMMEVGEADAMGMNMYKVLDDSTPPVRMGIKITLPEKQADGTLAPVTYVTVAKKFNDTTTIQIEKDSWRVWRILNLSPDTHPFHIHLVQFQGLKRYTFTLETPPPGSDPFAFSFSQMLSEADLAPNEQGWKDTIRVNPGKRDGDNIKTAEMLTLAAQFTGHSGRYMYHCHILEHEDQEMMRPFLVTPKALMTSMPGH